MHAYLECRRRPVVLPVAGCLITRAVGEMSAICEISCGSLE